jgi:hypothetical protein
VLEIHLALHVPKSESLQLFDSQPQRLRPSDSVRLKRFFKRSLFAQAALDNVMNCPTRLNKSVRWTDQVCAGAVPARLSQAAYPTSLRYTAQDSRQPN